MKTKDEALTPEVRPSFVICHTSSGLEVQGTLLRFTRYLAVFEIYNPAVALRMSEVLTDFKMVLNDCAIYSGRAVVSNLINAGEILVCEATLDEHWVNLQPVSWSGVGQSPVEFEDFLQQWQRTYTVLPEFKVVVADMQSLLTDMRLWLDQVELSIRSSPNGDRIEMERLAASRLATPALSAIDSLGDRFEEIASRLEPDMRSSHIHFTRRNLHSLLLCSPFSYRTYYKPLGYAGDYEMVNMILRNPYEGGSLFAKVVNAWFLNQLPAQAHRNRIKLLKDKLAEETLRMVRVGRQARIFSLGCGPATEVGDFLAETELCDSAGFTLLDFNEETIQHTSHAINEISRRFGRRTSVQLRKKSVQQILKEAARSGEGTSEGKYDFLYCAGLFDYLPDRVCKQLMNIFYEWLAPGGLLLATNVDGTRPFRNKLEFILDWNLLYRNQKQLSDLRPDQALAEDCSIRTDLTSVNVFLEIRKPNNA